MTVNLEGSFDQVAWQKLTEENSRKKQQLYPLFYVKTKEEVDAVLADASKRQYHLTVEHPDYCRTAAMFLFRDTDKYDLADYIVSKGGSFDAEQNFNAIGRGNFYLKNPHIHRLILEADWNLSRERHREIESIQDILIKSCEHFHRGTFHWAITKLEEAKIPFTKIDSWKLLWPIVIYGWVEILDHPIWGDMSYLRVGQKKALIDLALDSGYPEVAITLQKKYHFPVTQKQQEEIDALLCALEKADAPAPTSINVLHSNSHGGNDNEAIYQREYARGVAYAVYNMSKKDCFIQALIEKLANHRRRMAALGNIFNQQNFGTKATCSTWSKFEGMYAEFGAIVQQRYQGRKVQAKLKIAGLPKPLELTEIHPDGWYIPPDTHDEVLLLSAEIAEIIHSEALNYSNPIPVEVLFGQLIWIMAHAHYGRGNPTIMYMLVDALCRHIGRDPIPHKLEGKDLNCMALCFDKQDDFVDWFVNRLPTEV